jgi:hypothetical protein
MTIPGEPIDGTDKNVTSADAAKNGTQGFSFVVFPFLKTRSEVSIGRLTFRSTDVLAGLTVEQAEQMREIRAMLFLKDDLRIDSASFAIVPSSSRCSDEHLENVRALVAYHYATPHPLTGNPFLSPEHASLVVFTRDRVALSLVRPPFHVSDVGPPSDLTADAFGVVEGYSCSYNLRHPFWAARGSRLYGPLPHLTLNISQDLGADLSQATERTDCHLLSELLERKATDASTRIFTAVRWFNAANQEADDEAVTLVSLAIAFETLLSLPEKDKTDRLVDAISLLLGRLPRLGVWARQFYDARSQIVHEGRALEVRFVATDSAKRDQGARYRSLLSYGRQIFQLCLGTLLVGAKLAEGAALQESLVTNQERFEKICRELGNDTVTGAERLERIDSIVGAAERHRFVAEEKLKLKTMIDACRLAAKVLLECGTASTPGLKKRLKSLSSAKTSGDDLDALCALNDLVNDRSEEWPVATSGILTGRALFAVVWGYVFMHFFWLKERAIREES